MNDHRLTVGDLRAAIEGVPDDAEVWQTGQGCGASIARTAEVRPMSVMSRELPDGSLDPMPPIPCLFVSAKS